MPADAGNKKITVCVPCYNEVQNAAPMADALTEIMQKQPYEYEIVFIDNCSTDGTKDVLRALAARDKRIKVLMNGRNYGTLDDRSGRNALSYVTGDVLIVLACDFQDPPELIPEFIHYWEQGYKVVCGQKTASEEGKLKYACRHLFYKIIQLFSDTPQYPHMSGITLATWEIYERILKADDDLIFKFALADMGYEIKLIPYKQKARRSGKSSYNLTRYLSYAIHTLTITSTAPLRLLTITGFLLFCLSFLIGCIYLVLKLAFWERFQAGMAPLLIGMFLLSSAQLLFIGIIGEYVGAVLRKVTHRPDVVLSETLNIDGKTKDIRTEGKAK